jgi:WD40 repeat protein
MSFSADGRWLASGTTDGSVSVWDFSERRVRSMTKAHAGMVTGLRWHKGELWTTSADRTLKRWRNDDAALTLLHVHHEKAALRFLQLLPSGWVASAGRELIIHQGSAIPVIRLELDRHIERIEVSDDGRHAAAIISGEIAIVDLTKSAVATLPISFSGIGYVGFPNTDSIVISKPDGLFLARVSLLEFVPFEMQ